MVKTHLTFAVREEVDVLRSTIVDLEAKVCYFRDFLLVFFFFSIRDDAWFIYKSVKLLNCSFFFVINHYFNAYLNAFLSVESEFFLKTIYC